MIGRFEALLQVGLLQSQIALFSLVFLLAASSLPQTKSNQGLGKSGRWFTYDGQPIFLVGYDCQEMACDPSIDYEWALDRFVEYRLNKVRIWLYCYWRPDDYLHPWVYLDGKFDLDQWNPNYWRRVKRFVSAALRRKIVVEVTIFAPNNIDEPDDWSKWAAWNKAQNRNGAFSSNPSGHFSPEFFALDYPETSNSGKRLRDYQQALVDKAVAELGRYPNVFFEVCNEFPVKNASIDKFYSWQLHWASRIAQSSSRLVACHAHEYVGDHTKGIQHFWDEPYVDVLTFHFASTDPKTISNLLHDAQQKGKILQCNEGGDPYNDLDSATRGAWGFFVSGGYYAFYEDDSSRIGSSGWISGAQRLKALRDVAEKLRFWEMSPVDSSGNEYDSLVTQGPLSNWQVLANPGSEYLVYFWGNQSSKEVKIQLPKGRYRYEWYDARDASLKGSGIVEGGAMVSIPAPPKSVWSAGLALVVKKETVKHLLGWLH